jgi:glutamine synthetase
MAVMLKAGLDGIKNQNQPPKPVDRNIYKMTEESAFIEYRKPARAICWKRSMSCSKG